MSRHVSRLHQTQVYKVPQIRVTKYVPDGLSRTYGLEDKGQLHVVTTTTDVEVYIARDLPHDDVVACLATELSDVLNIKLNMNLFFLVLLSQQPERHLEQLERAKARPVLQRVHMVSDSFEKDETQEINVDEFRSVTTNQRMLSRVEDHNSSGADRSLANPNLTAWAEYEPLDLGRQSQQNGPGFAAPEPRLAWSSFAKLNMPVPARKDDWHSPEIVLGKRRREFLPKDDSRPDTTESGIAGEYFVSFLQSQLCSYH
jgi:hypothetical protein